MKASVTYGTLIDGRRGALERIYDRLRKRSWRQRCEGKPHRFRITPTLDHQMYVAGVKDALNAVAVDGE